MTIEDKVMAAMTKRREWYTFTEIMLASGLGFKRTYDALYRLCRKHYVQRDVSFHTTIYMRVKEVT